MFNIKKLLCVGLLLPLSGCGTTLGSDSIQIEPFDLSTPLIESSIAKTDHDVYFVENASLYYYNINRQKVARLTGMSFADDQEVENDRISYTRYFESFVQDSDLIYYGDYLYGLFARMSADGGSAYSLGRLNRKGEAYEEVLRFETLPLRFRIDSGFIYVLFEDEVTGESIIEVYDHHFKLIERNLYPESIQTYQFFIDKGQLRIPEEPLTVYEDEIMRLYYEIHRTTDDSNTSLENARVTAVFSKGDHEIRLDNKIIMYANKDYFYTSSLDGIQAYEQYDHNGTLISRVVPAETITSRGPESAMFTRSDFSLMLRVVDDRYVFGKSQEAHFICDLAMKECDYLVK